jgi:NAD(P)-dependent dehydrogenase (short-subunit alcohol dehydrogenase family)
MVSIWRRCTIGTALRTAGIARTWCPAAALTSRVVSAHMIAVPACPARLGTGNTPHNTHHARRRNSMARLLEGKVAVVTGAGRGIGREEALLMAKHGAKVVVNDLGAHFDGTGADQSPAQQVVNEIKAAGGEAVANGDSVSDFKAAKRIVQCAIDTFGKLNIVINNAGILRDRMIFNMGEEDWDAVIGVHLKGAFNMSRHACEYWREEHKKGNVLNGRIVNTSSDAGLLGNVGQTNYGAAKAAVALMAMVMDAEMQKYGVCCNAIAPVARTRLTVDATPSTAAFMGKKVEEGKFDVFDPRNIAPLVAWLASDDAKDVHGEVFRVGGGTVWLMQGWHSVGKVSQKATWEPAALGGKLKAELAKGVTAKENIGAIMAEALSA